MPGVEEAKEAIRNAANGMVPSATYGDELMQRLAPALAIAGVSNNQEFMSAVARAAETIQAIKLCTGILAQCSQVMLDYADHL